MALLSRPALRLLPALLALAAVPLLGQACSSGGAPTPPLDAGADAVTPEDDGGVVEDPGPPAPAEWDRAVTAPTDVDAQTARTACGYKAGSLPAETQGASHPIGKAIPINHVVVVMQENRSFDHYFFKLHEAGHPDAEVAPSDFTNPDKNGKPVAPYRDKQLCFADTAHSWASAHTEWNDGKMDGFVLANDNTGPIPPGGTAETVSGNRAMTYYEPADLPFMYQARSPRDLGRVELSGGPSLHRRTAPDHLAPRDRARSGRERPARLSSSARAVHPADRRVPRFSHPSPGGHRGGGAAHHALSRGVAGGRRRAPGAGRDLAHRAPGHPGVPRRARRAPDLALSALRRSERDRGPPAAPGWPIFTTGPSWRITIWIS